MPGCLIPPKHCTPPDDDTLSDEDRKKLDTVRRYIDALWNLRWSRDDVATARAVTAKGGEPVVPSLAEDALANLLHRDFTRHRRDEGGNRRKGGLRGFRGCLAYVHGAVTDLEIAVLDGAVSGDVVTVLLLIEGRDRRPDGATDVEGLFGAPRPTGRRFQIHTAAMFRLEDGLIRDDYLLYGADLLFLGRSLAPDFGAEGGA